MLRITRARVLAGAALGASLVAHVLVTLAGADPFKMIDLRVYLDGARWALDGVLYDVTSDSTSASGDPINLPFTYPPFAALTFLPWSALNDTFARVLWQLLSVVALAAMLYLTLRLLGRAGPNSAHPVRDLPTVLLIGTALALWFEPVRTTLNYGQVNLFLAVLLLAGAVTTQNWLAGTTVGIAAGIKLVPAIAGLYYLSLGRWRAVVASVLAFAGTVLVGAVVLPAETRRYFLELIFDPARTGPVFGAINQSWRGALARLAGEPDVPGAWMVAVAATAALGLWALWRTARVGDRVAAFVAVQMVGLLVSPISWSHHWVWAVPVLVWCLFGSKRAQLGVRILAAAWVLAGYSYLVSILVAQPGNYDTADRPIWAALAGLVYVLLGVASLGVLGSSAERAKVRADR